eukprot:comp24298_c0_seq1/m.45560 comp24298_c0_seq1/g.45560  ORF comp24298_c0_seq1/g.45560 comp24298_c0_seq1/m.45560 type:complete len:1025 (+) comp24298_c0_seq1:2711-5785(+)
MDRAVGKAVGAVGLDHLVGEGGGKCTVRVDNAHVNRHGLLLLQRGLRQLDQLVVLALSQLVQLLGDIVRGGTGAQLRGHLEDGGKVQAPCLEVEVRVVHAQLVCAANHLVDGVQAQLGHDLAAMLGHHEEVVDHVLWLARKLLAQLGVLCGNTHGACVQVALAHHRAAHDDEGHSGKPELLGTKQAGNGNVTAVTDLTVGLEDDTATEVVLHQCLVGLRQTQLPRQTGMLDTGPTASTGSTVVARDENVVGKALGHTGSNHTHTDLRHELDAHAGLGVGALQIVDQLLEILDRVDVVVGGRGDQAHAGGGVTARGNGLGHLVAGQLTALTGLCTLGHLDLKLVRIGQVPCRHTETARGHLLDGRPQGVTVSHGGEARIVLTTLTRVGLAPNAVHGKRKRAVSLERDGTVAHSTGAEPTNNVLSRLDLLKGNLILGLEVEVEETAQGAVGDLLVGFDDVAVVAALVVALGGVLDGGNGVGRVHMVLTTIAPVEVTGVLHHLVLGHVLTGIGVARDVAGEGLHGQDLHVHTLDAACAVGKAAVNHIGAKTNGLEDLGALVGLQSADAHLGHHLAHAVVHGRLEVLGNLIVRHRGNEILLAQASHGLEYQVGADGVAAKAHQHTDLVHNVDLTTLEDDAALQAGLLPQEVLVHGTDGQSGRNGHTLRAHSAVGEDQQLVALLNGLGGFLADPVQRLGQTSSVLRAGEGDVECSDLPAGMHSLHLLDGTELLDRQNGVVDHKAVALGTAGGQDVECGANGAAQRHDDLLAEGIDGGVGDLGKKLLEVVVDQAGLLAQAGKGCIVTHRAQSLLGALHHGLDQHVDVLDGPAKGLQAAVLEHAGAVLDQVVVCILLVQLGQQVRHADGLSIKPLLEGLGGGHLVLELGIVHDKMLLRVHQQHAARLQAALCQHVLKGCVQHTDLGAHDHAVVIHDVVTGRAQTVTVENGTNVATIREGEERRPVPGLLHERGPLVEGTLVLWHVLVVLPGLRHHHHHDFGQGACAVHQLELEHVVKSSRVRTAGLNDGEE